MFISLFHRTLPANTSRTVVVERFETFARSKTTTKTKKNKMNSQQTGNPDCEIQPNDEWNRKKKWKKRKYKQNKSKNE